MNLKKREHDDSLLAAILPERHRDPLRPVIQRLLSVSEFPEFVRNHEQAIARELRQQTSLQDCLDVVTELEFACMLSPHVTDFDYQLKIQETGKCLDFVLHFPSSATVGVEVKRIRELEAVVALYGQAFEIPYTQKESFKFTDRILEALWQLRPKCPNVVFVQIDSSTHEPEESSEAMAHVVNHFHRGNEEFFERKGFRSRDEFMGQYRKLSVVMVRSGFTELPGTATQPTRNRVLKNPYADFAISDDIVDVFLHADICT